MKKGDIHYINDTKLVLEGAYFDWPWWKRVLGTAFRRPVAWASGLRYLLWRLTEPRPYTEIWQGEIDGTPYTWPTLEMCWEIGYSLGSSWAKPIFYRLERKEGG